MAFDLHLGCCQAAEAESAGRLMSNLEDLVTRPDSASRMGPIGLIDDD